MEKDGERGGVGNKAKKKQIEKESGHTAAVWLLFVL